MMTYCNHDIVCVNEVRRMLARSWHGLTILYLAVAWSVSSVRLTLDTFSSGVYFVHVRHRATGAVVTGKMLLVK